MLKAYSLLKKQIFYVLYILLFLFKNPIIKKKIKEKYFFYIALSKKNKMDNIFHKKKLVYSKNLGFYQLDPMPKKTFLNEYYNNFYWQGRDDINNLLRERDFLHFEEICKYKFNHLNIKKTMLNFGSGHGGVSVLFKSNNFKVYNLDYQKNSLDLFSKDYYFVKKFDEIPKNTKFNLIYSSHALEHAINYLEVFRNFKKYSNNTTVYFFEVPNGLNQTEIIPPHTYYYTKKFFEKIFKPRNSKSFFLCDVFSNNKCQNTDNFKGGVIRIFTNYSIVI